MSKELRIGIDIGGTFTDFTVVNDRTGEIDVEKVLTTSADPERAVFEGLAKLAERSPGLLAHAEDIVHATTLVTNVILERRGGKTALITTEGFRDVLEIRREVRYDVYDLFIEFPQPLVPRALRFGVRERILVDGTVRLTLNENDVADAARQMVKQGVQALGICFLHAYREPTHELRAAEIVREIAPNMLISLSHEVHPEPKEYERTSTTVADAYVKTALRGYLARLGSGLTAQGFNGTPLVMLSNGGSAALELAQSYPIQIVESGPAAGVSAALYFAKLLGLKDALAFDMGGTTAKLCHLRYGEAARSRTFEVDRAHRFKAGSGLPVGVSVFDLVEIGAGGGSIARCNGLGLLQVGPESASSLPGPACYGRGGIQPTVTDADLALGCLGENSFLGGDMKLDRPAAMAAIAALGDELGLDGARTAIGIYELVTETMAAAARAYVAEKGHSASEMTIIASGGAGPVHATALARRLGCARVIIPPYSGVMSSLGLLTAPIAFERVRSVRRLLDDITVDEIGILFAALEAEAADLLHADRLVFERSVDLQYAGQDYPLEIPVTPNEEGSFTLGDWAIRFSDDYQNLYGRTGDDNPVQVVSLRVRAVSAKPSPRLTAPVESAIPKPVMRGVFDTNRRQFVDTPIYQRATLGAGATLIGPLVVEERESTTVLGSADRLTVDASGCLIIDVAQPGDGATKETQGLEFAI